MKLLKDKYQKIDILDKQKYIKLIKDKFEKILSKKLDLIKVSAPVVITKSSGLQDDLSGVERAVSFDIQKDGSELEIVQSLAKWKRFALKKYGFPMHTGLYTDMKAIRRDDKIDATHSIFVDQYDWEKVISSKDRSIEYLKKEVKKIVRSIYDTYKYLESKGIKYVDICPDCFFITSQELLTMYPDLTPKQREYEIVKKYKTVFIMQIGDDLSDGTPHDLRAPDYDDWSLDGDLMFYFDVLDIALEISSMGIRVDKKSLEYQMIKDGRKEDLSLPYHLAIMEDKLPLSIGGGIGQSRLCQLLLGRVFIGEVQASYWDRASIDWCESKSVELL